MRMVSQMLNLYYVKYVSDGFAKYLLDEISEKTGIPKTKLLEEMGMSKGTPYKHLGEESKMKIIKKALEVLDPKEVLEGIAHDLLTSYERILLDLVYDLAEVNGDISKVLNVEQYEEMIDKILHTIKEDNYYKRKINANINLNTKTKPTNYIDSFNPKMPTFIINNPRREYMHGIQAKNCYTYTPYA